MLVLVDTLILNVTVWRAWRWMPIGCFLILACLVFHVVFLIGNSLSGCKYLVPVSAWDSCPVESVVRTYLVAINLWQSSVTINLLADFYHFLLITLYFWVLDSCWFLSLFTDYIVYFSSPTALRHNVSSSLCSIIHTHDLD